MAQLLKLKLENIKLKDRIKQYEQAYGCCPHVEDSILKGGYRVVQTIEDRDAIPCCYRKQGMVVMVINDETPYSEYLLNTDTCDNVWQLIDNTGGITEVNWGDILGDLSDQTDLFLILNNKADLSDIPTLLSELTNDVGYITGYIETDPTVPSHVKAITTSNITSWNSKLSNITGLIQQGPYITITGSGTTLDPYIITANDMSSINETIRTWITPPYIDIETKEYPGMIMTENCNLKSIVITSTTAPTGSDIDVSIWKRGSMSAMVNVVIPIGSHVSNPVLLVSGNTFNAGQELYFVVNQKGSTIAGQGLQSKLGIEKI